MERYRSRRMSVPMPCEASAAIFWHTSVNAMPIAAMMSSSAP